MMNRRPFQHTSRWNGWMQGAIESAYRVVKEICG
jgi:monoamine oxidase